jgi:hypothetical protein
MRKTKNTTRKQVVRTKVKATNKKGQSAGSKLLVAITEATEILRSQGLHSPKLKSRTYDL